MSAPQVVMNVLFSLGLLISANEHGKPRSNANFWTSLIAACIEVAILWWGGFWR